MLIQQDHSRLISCWWECREIDGCSRGDAIILYTVGCPPNDSKDYRNILFWHCLFLCKSLMLKNLTSQCMYWPITIWFTPALEDGSYKWKVWLVAVGLYRPMLITEVHRVLYFLPSIVWIWCRTFTEMQWWCELCAFRVPPGQYAEISKYRSKSKSMEQYVLRGGSDFFVHYHSPSLQATI